MIVKHQLFADDMCVWSYYQQCSTPEIYCDYAANHEIIFNCNKATNIIFPLKNFTQPAAADVSLS